MASFRPKPWTNPFGEMSVFRPFLTSRFYSLESCFIVLEYHKTHVSVLFLQKKQKLEKWPISTKTMD